MQPREALILDLPLPLNASPQGSLSSLPSAGLTLVSSNEFYVSFSISVLDIPSRASWLQKVSEHAKSPDFL